MTGGCPDVREMIRLFGDLSEAIKQTGEVLGLNLLHVFCSQAVDSLRRDAIGSHGASTHPGKARVGLSAEIYGARE